MPVFISDEEFAQLSAEASQVAEKAEVYIRGVYGELETVRAQADAASITAEQTCSLLEQKYLGLSAEFTKLESQNAQLQTSLDDRLSELAQVQSQKHQLHLLSISKDGEMERLMMEASELHKSKRQLIELVEQKDLENSEKNATIKSYLDKIVNLTDISAQKESRLSQMESELSRSQANSARLLQEKELIERHNLWVNEELTAKVDTLIELRRAHSELEADMSTKLADAQRQCNEFSVSLNWNKERVKELEMKLGAVQEDFCKSKDAAAANEERSSAELATANKLVSLYKESSEEWSRKAGELEGVIKALETHLVQVENDYKERLDEESSARQQFEKDVAHLKDKLGRCEEEIESCRKANELNLLPLSNFTSQKCLYDANEIIEIPKIPFNVSGTALAASLLRDGWSLATMYAKYQEAIDGLRHEQLGRKESEAILQRVLCELEEKAGVIMDEREEHERMVEAYSAIDQKLQHMISDEANLETTIQELKADLRKRERDCNLAHKEIVDLQKQVTVLLKECRDVQLRWGSSGQDQVEEYAIVSSANVCDTEMLTFKDINGLVEQNVQLRSLVRNLSDQIQNRESELKNAFEMDLKKHTDEAASKVSAVLERAEEQGRMIESLHTSVAMYKRLYEEEHKVNSSNSRSIDAAPVNQRKDVLLVLESSQEASKREQEKASERIRSLEEDLAITRSEIISLRSERDKLALEATFVRERLDSFTKEFDHQRDEMNGILARNVEFSQLIVDYQRRVRESSESSRASEELNRKSTMELAMLKHEKEMLSNAEKRACDEVRCLSERVYRLQATLDTIQSAEEVREEARAAERRKQEEHIKQVEREWAEGKNELQQEREIVRALTLDRDQTLKSALRQVEEMGKELSNALRAISAADSRAAVAEAKFFELEKKFKASDVEISGLNNVAGSSSALKRVDLEDLHTVREELAACKEEARANKDHMLQYKSIAQVNETALKQMEVAHENYKMEAEKLKESLESELLLLRMRTTELENELCLKSQEVALAAGGKEEALSSAYADITSLKEGTAIKIAQIIALEVQVSALKEDLDKEHERWRASQANYERQVILQSETIQELTKTSQSLATIQQEVFELRKLADTYKSENTELKAKLEIEKLMLEKSSNEVRQKYDELNEQNKMLHSRLEALHIQLAEKQRNSAGMCSQSTSPDSLGDGDLQNVVSYLRRSKEIAETEISLLKQEKLRLQTRLESALKAAENAQVSLNAERSTSRALLLTDEEIKSMQLQVREINLLRESNMQLRAENKHNFEECQRLHGVAQNAKVEYERLESLLREKQTESDSFRKETEALGMEKEQLEKRVSELLDTCKNIDVEEYWRMKDYAQQFQKKTEEKDAELQELKNQISKLHGTVSKLEQDFENSKLELSEREKRITEFSQAEASLRSELEKQKRLNAQSRRKSETASKDKEDLGKQNQALLKQMEDLKQSKRFMGSFSGEQAIKDKEEKETRIQTLETTVKKQREELRREKEDHQSEKVKLQDSEKNILESYMKADQGKVKFTDEFEKHKQAVKRLSDELHKIKQAEKNMPEGTSVVQFLTGTVLDDFAASYMAAINDFEKIAQATSLELGISLPLDSSSVGDITSQAVIHHAPIIIPASPTKQSKTVEQKETRTSLPKTKRKIVRPPLDRFEKPQVVDTEMSEGEGTSNGAKLARSQDTEIAGRPSLSTVLRKRQVSSSPEMNELESQADTSSDPAAPLLKKAKASDYQQEDALGKTATLSENIFSLPDIEVLPDTEPIDAEKEEVDIAEDMSKELELLDPVELQIAEGNEEMFDKPIKIEMMTDDRDQADEDMQHIAMDSDGEREEGELLPDAVENEATVASPELIENQENLELLVSPSLVDEEFVAVDSGDVASNDEKNEAEKTDEIDETEENDGNNQTISAATDSNVETGLTAEESISAAVAVSATAETEETKQTAETEEVKHASPSSTNVSTVVNLKERAKEKAALRQMASASASASGSGTGTGTSSPTVGRGRGRVLRGRGGVRGRGRIGRGQQPPQQG